MPDDGGALQAVFEQASCGSAEALDKALAAIDDVNSIGTFSSLDGERETTALYEAVASDNVDAVDLLLSQPGIDVNAKPAKFYHTPLACAAAAGNVGLVNTLLKVEGVDVNNGHDGYGSPLALACVAGRSEVVAALLASDATDTNSLSRNGYPPISEAIKLHRTDILRQLLEDDRVDMKAEVAGQEGCTPFVLACALNFVDIVDILIASGRVDVKEEVDDAGLLEAAAQSGFDDLFSSLEGFFMAKADFEELPTKEHSKKLRYVFKLFDADDSGKVPMSCLGDIARELGEELSEEELREACVALDTNKNGTIEFEELVAFWTG